MSSGDVLKPNVSSDEKEEEALENIKFNFNIESLGLVLYSNDPKQVSQYRKMVSIPLGSLSGLKRFLTFHLDSLPCGWKISSSFPSMKDSFVYSLKKSTCLHICSHYKDPQNDATLCSIKTRCTGG